MIKMITSLAVQSIAIFKLTHRSSFNISSNAKRLLLLEQLQKDIIDRELTSNTQDESHLNYFKSREWSIKYYPIDTLFQYSRNKDNYTIITRTFVKSDPPNLPKTEEEKIKSMKLQQVNFALVSVYLQKKGMDKWMAIEFAIAEDVAEMVTVFFQETAQQKVVNKVESAYAYEGADPATINPKLFAALSDFLSTLGITKQTLINMVLHASTKDELIHLDWLRNIRQLLE